MYPDLSYILHDLIGTQPDNFFSVVKTFGLLLVLAFIASAYTLKAELRRKYKEGKIGSVVHEQIVGAPASTMELISQGLLGFILGFKGVYVFQHLGAFRRDAASVILSTDGVWWAGIVGALLFAVWRYFKAKSNALPQPKTVKETIAPQDKVWDITMVAAISGIIGAKLFAIVESQETLSNFFSDPIGTLLSGSGLAIYGGLIVAFAAVYYYVKKNNIKPIHMMDAVAPALMVGYAVGRIGCQLSGDGDWGIVNTLPEPGWWILPDWMWSYDYPHNVLNRGVPIEGCDWNYCHRLEAGVYPTPFYETVVSFLFAGILWLLRKRMQVAGTLFALYMIMNGVERFFIEKIRVNDKIDLGSFQATQAEIISVLTVLGGIILWVVLVKRSKSRS